MATYDLNDYDFTPTGNMYATYRVVDETITVTVYSDVSELEHDIHYPRHRFGEIDWDEVDEIVRRELLEDFGFITGEDIPTGVRIEGVAA